MVETGILYPLVVNNRQHAPLFPAGVTAAHRSLEPFDEVRILGGEPRQSHSGTPNPSSVSE